MMLRSLIAVVLVAAVVAQDPAPGWLAYAMGVSPDNPNERITYIEAKWVNLQNPSEGGGFYSPWFGIEASDNLNLIQPVNPWVGNGWLIYNEYFQWSPVHNYDSAQHSSSPGDVLFGSCRFDSGNQSYSVYHKDQNNGWSVTSNIPVQRSSGGGHKNFTIAYFVFEKVMFSCRQYPPNNEVLFYDIKIEFEGVQKKPHWTTGVVDEACQMTAHVVNETAIKITWNSGAANPDPEYVRMVQAKIAARNVTRQW
eukprot:NODE_1410_length_870_cov_127.752355_g1364_i0.p1 GENE.NODE_1410_length_870_cov_127.752355_g1364_i0~~NODE_1410_length_870_cov_127.752355_g1364_i0.p1  ORF type:complete len:252 (+),score=57.71 NODE_1410_length_870_cov_127.752355_g1364_i0:61-816(+)